jgi:hypothetical protein
MCNDGCDCEWLADEQQMIDQQLQAEAAEAEAAMYEAQLAEQKNAAAVIDPHGTEAKEDK